MTQLKVLTWNIHFKDLTQERITRILSIISIQNPDIICLQEIPHSMVNSFQLPDYPNRFGAQFQHQYNTLVDTMHLHSRCGLGLWISVFLYFFCVQAF